MELVEYLPIIVAILLFFVLYYSVQKHENFSKSGMSISDRKCMELADVYYKPTDNNPKNRNQYRREICSPLRRKTVNFPTGNYFTEHGELV
jgi:hypothetical protein